jgi:hypothetical protein
LLSTLDGRAVKGLDLQSRACFAVVVRAPVVLKKGRVKGQICVPDKNTQNTVIQNVNYKKVKKS